MVLENLREDPSLSPELSVCVALLCWYLSWPPLVVCWPSQPILAPGRSGVTVGAEMRNRLPRKGVAGKMEGGMPTGAMPPVLLPARVCCRMAVLVLAVS